MKFAKEGGVQPSPAGSVSSLLASNGAHEAYLCVTLPCRIGGKSGCVDLPPTAGDDALQHFAFARRERGRALLDIVEFGAGLAIDAVSFDGDANRLEEIFVVERLGEEARTSGRALAVPHR